MRIAYHHIPLLGSILLQSPAAHAQSHVENANALHSQTPRLELVAMQVNNTGSELENDLLKRVSGTFQLPVFESGDVRDYETWYSERPDYLERMFSRSKRYLGFIFAEVERRGLPGELALLPAIESAYRPEALSSSGASGLWQFIPSTGAMFGLRQDDMYDGRQDIVRSTMAALDYLEELNAHFDGDWFLALAAYNGGKGYITRAVTKNVENGRPSDFANLDLRSETRRFVPKLLAIRNILASPEKWNLELPSVDSGTYFRPISAPAGTHLRSIARSSGINIVELTALNPAFKQMIVPAEGPLELLVPSSFDTEIVFSGKQMASATTVAGTNSAGNREKSSKWRFSSAPDRAITRTYRVRPGDTLWSISKLFGVPVNSLLQWNEMLTPTLLSPGQSVRIHPL